MRIKEILNRRKFGKDYISGDDLKHVMSILKNHSDFMLKQGCGISRVFSDNTKYGNRCFFFERTDGSIIDISYTHALKPKNKLDDIKAACRSAIRPVIKDYIIKNYNGFCEVTKKAIQLNEMHVDHYDKTFIELFAIWIKDKNISELHSLINKSDGLCFDTFFENEDIKNDFIAFHNANTHLRCVSKEFNLKRGKNI